ncbi:MAG: acyl-CoA dehydrogenase family protein [Endozoicomonadaceae bacterium]|nr:acyl-CoA dehydrogenase family protein [Endozoicomonadaceae bacterium]MCY4328777.1 acyl-CoA dehydrogenase family protein [Endozoicomonadaceae bacterium]
MNFSLSSDQQAFQRAARDFADAELTPLAAEWDANAHFPVDVLHNAGKQGFLGIYTPDAQGGLGLLRLDASIIFEQLARGCTSTTAYITIHNMVAWMIASFAEESVKQEYACQLAEGELLSSYCLTEPEAGSDAASLKTRATLKHDDYILNGSKAFISGAGSTQILLVMARTGEQGPGGISAFLVPANLRGINYGRKEEKLGWNSQPTRAITFDNVTIPKRFLLGKEGDGFRFAMAGLDGGRVNIASCSVGTAQQALTATRDYMMERKQFGKTLSAFQALQFKLADMETELVAARQMVRLAANKLDCKHPCATTYCAMAKRFATDVGFNICDQALQLHGGYGYIKEYPFERYLRDTRVHRILEGSNEIMRLIVARRLFSEERPELL